MKRIIIYLIAIIILTSLSVGCISSDMGGNNKKVELTIKNSTNETVQVLLSVSKDDDLLYNESILINPEEDRVINEFDRGFGIYHFYLFVDEDRVIDTETGITKTQYPPEFDIVDDRIIISQVEV
jgi:hypothetical protein